MKQVDTCRRSVSFGLVIFLRLIVMPLDGVVHANAQYDNFERQENYWEKVYPFQVSHFEYFQSVAWNCLSFRIGHTRNAPLTTQLQDRQAWSF
ncbi:conserved hypothetical protein [Agrobacterium fabacearum TT111]|nr:conserved hypothetical protein [Agrobacterium fabacearum TT111]